MSTKHTLGPWKAVHMGVGQWNVTGSGKVVAHVANWALPSFHAEQEANARLIAASPDLLMALNAMATYHDDVPKAADQRLLDAAYAAIAKATGEQQ